VLTGTRDAPVSGGFIASAFAYLALGAGLGMEMAVRPGLVADWRSIHAHLNVNGFLSLLIFGMSYLFVPVFARRHLALASWARTHLWVAHAAVWGLVVGRALRWWPASAVGGLAQVASTLLFAAVIVATIRRGEPLDRRSLTGALAAVANAPASVDLDRIATRFTRMALIYLVISSLGGAALSGAAGPSARETAAIIWFTVVGFIVMMLSGIAYHLIPRLSGHGAAGAAPARWHFWALAVSAPVLAAGYVADARTVAGAGHLLEAAALAVFAWNLWPALRAGQMPGGSVRFVQMALIAGAAGAALAAARGLGIALPLPRPPLLHLHLLGLATMTAFGVSYALISLERPELRLAWWPAVHPWVHAGALLGMIVGFAGVPAALAISGPVQFAGIAGFLATFVRYRLRSGSQPYTGRMSTGA
jgi:hypothetical protein